MCTLQVKKNNSFTYFLKHKKRFFLSAILQKIWNHIFKNPTGIKQYLIRESSLSASVQIGSIGIGFLSSMIFAKQSGSAGYGEFAYLFSWVSLLQGFCLMGYDDYALRQVALYEKEEKWGHIQAFLKFSCRKFFLNSVLIVIFFLISLYAFPFLYQWLNLKDIPFIINILYTTVVDVQYWGIALLNVPILAYIIFFQSVLIARYHATLALIPEKVIKPVGFLVGICFSLYFWQNSVFIFWQKALIISTFCGFLALIASIFLYQKKVIKPLFAVANVSSAQIHSIIEQNRHKWQKQAWSFFAIVLINLIYTKLDTIILGVFSGKAAVGVYGIASKVSELMRLVLVVVSGIISPVIASLYTQQNMAKLQALATQTAQKMLWLALIPFVFFVVIGKWALTTFFGTDFTEGYTPLLILATGQLCNVAAGAGATFLMMTGNNKEVIKGLYITAFANVFLCLCLTPFYNATGAAIAMAFSTLIWNVFLVHTCYQKLRINITAVPFFAKKK